MGAIGGTLASLGLAALLAIPVLWWLAVVTLVELLYRGVGVPITLADYALAVLPLVVALMMVVVAGGSVAEAIDRGGRRVAGLAPRTAEGGPMRPGYRLLPTAGRKGGERMDERLAHEDEPDPVARRLAEHRRRRG